MAKAEQEDDDSTHDPVDLSELFDSDSDCILLRPSKKMMTTRKAKAE